ncbi:MAG: hypothetical protein VB957_01580 [Pseudomonadales bacterium]|jgi:hypothetical protein
MIKRRNFLQYSASLSLMASIPRQAFAAGGVKAAISESDLVYITPIQSNGKESSCQSEVWFVNDGTDMYVVTASNAWRATAPGKGLTRARLWIGDLGEWKATNGKYKSLPQVDAEAVVISDAKLKEKALDMFGDKYSMEWLVWGSRFRKGLGDGSRTLLRYRPMIS